MILKDAVAYIYQPYLQESYFADLLGRKDIR